MFATELMACVLRLGAASRVVRYPVGILFIAYLVTVHAAEELGALTLSADEWARPRSGVSVSQMPAVRQLAQRWMDADMETAQIQIRYPGGESGTLWAVELRDWLIALGIPSDAIVTESGSPNGDELLLDVITQ